MLTLWGVIFLNADFDRQLIISLHFDTNGVLQNCFYVMLHYSF